MRARVLGVRVCGPAQAHGYAGPTLSCLTAPGGMSWTKQGGQALTSSDCATALTAILATKPGNGGQTCV